MKTTLLKIIGALAILATMIVTPDAKSETLFGRCIGVTDGDTVTILDKGNVQHVIRLFAIDAPETSCHRQKPSSLDDECVERGQPFGRAAKKSLSDLVYGKEVNVELQPGETYGRRIGTVWAGPINANLEQVKRGYAMMYRKYALHGLLPDEFREMENAERVAQERGLGLWSDPDPVPPWRFRHPNEHHR